MLYYFPIKRIVESWNLLHQNAIVRNTSAYTHKNQRVIIHFYSSRRDAKIYFHRKDQFLDFSGRMGYKILLKEVIQSQVSWEDVRYFIQFYQYLI